MFVRSLIVLSVISFVGGAVSIAFLYESQTLWYKIGVDKITLRTGQVAGLLAASLLVLQIIMGIRPRLLGRSFGLATLMRCHRINGVIVGVCVLLHAILILVPEGMTNLPIGRKYWPEMIGILLLWVVLSMVISSQFREKLKLDYKLWRRIHRPFAYIAAFLLAVHVFFVSDSFQQTVPRAALLITFLSLFIWVVWHKISFKSK